MYSFLINSSIISAFNIGYEGMEVPWLWKTERSNTDLKELENRDKTHVSDEKKEDKIDGKSSPSDGNENTKAFSLKTITVNE
jgi:hypothetical protein